MKRITTPLTAEQVSELKSGDSILLSGFVYIARDAAHKKMIEMLRKGKELPFDIRSQVIYYCGPCPPGPGSVIGSAGPTTSGRMDAYAPELIELGLAGMIGKGLRSKEVVNAMVRHGAVYFGAIGGAGALIADCIKSQEIIAFPELGPEALRKAYAEEFPLTVVIDSTGSDLYDSGRRKYANLYDR